jgi:hypothetical protein
MDVHSTFTEEPDMLRRRRIVVSLGLAVAPFVCLALAAKPANAQSQQTNYLAVSEVLGGSKGQVQIFQLDASGNPSSVNAAPYATITGLGVGSAAPVVNPFGMAYSNNNLYIASLGSNQILDFNLATSSLSVFRNITGG